MPKVTVVIPAYNATATLPTALESVQEQTFQDWEIVVVDDGSRDGSANLAEQWGEQRIRVIRQANAGPSAARNRGIAAAKGEWVAFLDADDAWESDKLSLQWAATQEHPDAVMITCDWHRPGITPSPPPAVIPWRHWTERDLLAINRFQTSTVLVRRTVLERAGNFDPSVDGAEDWELWIRIAREGTVVHLSWPLVAYADSPEGVSKDLDRVYRCGRTMLERHLAGQSRGQRAELMAWHHLRFAVAFRLEGDPRYQACLAPLKAPAAWPGTARAVLFRLLPFMLGRLQRRLRSKAAVLARH